MSQKVRKTLIMVVMAALIICLMAASLTYTFTYGRYAGGKFDEESPYDDLIEFVGANQYLVYSPEELIQAIKDGYSNIQIADEAEQPFVITEGVTDVTANLVLDVNGKTLIRNSRNPMLDVQTNVSVVLVYDSSDDEQGGFYNPVGSALQASGGTLTVGSGGYESGPKDGEYTSDIVSTTTAYLVTRESRTSAYGEPAEVDNLPQVGGNVYYSTESGGENTEPEGVNTDYIKDDTFLIYTEEQGELVIGKLNGDGDVVLPDSDGYDDLTTPEQIFIQNGDEVEALSVACNVASCDFYYYYDTGDWIDADGKRKQGERPTTGFTPIYAVIYGYWDVMKLARDDGGAATALKGSGLIHPYGAVRMEEGEGFARGGQFSNHFDAVNTYGIYAEGGTLTASGANFTTGGNGVCIRVQSAEAEDKTTGGSLTISGGEFSSEIGNTIEMSGGNMTVTAGTFTKTGGKGIGSSGDEQVANQTAMIDMQGGKLTITGSESNSVTMTAGGTVTNPDGTVTDNGGTLTNVFGILAHSGGEVFVGGCTFNINGNYSAGVLSYDGTINLNNNTVITVTQSDEHKQDGKTLLTSSAVSSEASAGDHPINMSGNVQITSNGLGITARGNINIKEADDDQSATQVQVETTRATGIYVNGGTFKVERRAQISVKSTVSADYAWGLPPEGIGTSPNIYNGVYVENGSIDASAGTLNVTHTGVAGDEPDNNSTTGAATKSYAVFVKGDAEGGSQNTTVSINAGKITGTNAGGVYVVGTSKQDGAQTTYTATVTLGGVTVTARNTYAAGILTETGNVIINGNAQITSSALGIAVINGNVGIDSNNQTVNASVKATRATGVYVRGGTLYNRGTLSVESDLADENNNNLFYQHTGADISTPSTDPNPYNGVYVKGGSLNSTGMLNVNFTGVENDARNASGNDQIAYDGENTSFLNQQTKSYAVRVEAGTGTTTVTIASGEIKNTVGGGVLVNGGTVHLGGYVDENGTAHTSQNPVTVQTTGTEVNTSPIHINGMADNWDYYWNMTGGDAVKVDGGELAVYGGTYTAAQGNGILTRGGTANIYNGTFTGGYNSTYHATTGAASTYSFKAYGGTVNISGGNFDSAAEGAFVMGTSASDKVTITGGSFQAEGPTAFATWNGATVEFDETNSEKKIIVSGESTGLTVEQVSSGWNSQNITIKSATFESTNQNESNKNGIWYGNGNAKLTISGGSFTGSTGSGLYFAANPGNNVQLSGGTYKGSNGAIDAKDAGRVSTGNIIAHNAYCFTQSVTGQGNENKAYAICKREYNAIPSGYNYYHVGGNGGNENVDLDDRTYVNGSDRKDFNRRETIFISDKNGKVSDYTVR